MSEAKPKWKMGKWSAEELAALKLVVDWAVAEGAHRQRQFMEAVEAKRLEHAALKDRSPKAAGDRAWRMFRTGVIPKAPAKAPATAATGPKVRFCPYCGENIEAVVAMA